MSNIKSKDLSYDKTASQPAFLQRLRDQNNAISSTGRHEQPIARAQRKKLSDEDDDAPTYVVEGSSETLTKAEYQKLTSAGGDEGQSDVKSKFGDVRDMVTGELTGSSPKASGALPDDENYESKDAPFRTSATIDAGKATKKRKVAKIVGGHDDEDDRKNRDQGESKPKKLKKRGKPVKLSFGDEE